MAVPDTNTFTLANVCDELSLVGANRNLVQAFAVADPGQFDPAYEGSKNSLLNFRNYGASSEILGVSPNPISIGNSNPSQILNVTANVDWGASVTLGSEWISITGGTGSGDGSFTANYTVFVDEGRVGNIRLQSSSGDTVINITVNEIG